MSTYTFGPWVSMKLESGAGHVILRRRDEDHAIGPAFVMVDEAAYGKEKAEANATLIAAAPELHETALALGSIAHARLRAEGLSEEEILSIPSMKTACDLLRRLDEAFCDVPFGYGPNGEAIFDIFETGPR